MCLLLTAVSRSVTQLYTYDTVTCMCSKLVKNFEILICPEVTRYIQIQALTNELKRSTQREKHPTDHQKEQNHLKERQDGRQKHNQ